MTTSRPAADGDGAAPPAPRARHARRHPVRRRGGRSGRGAGHPGRAPAGGGRVRPPARHRPADLPRPHGGGRGGRGAGPAGAPDGDAARRPAADRRARVPGPRGGVRAHRAGQPGVGHQLVARARAGQPLVRRRRPRSRHPAAHAGRGATQAEVGRAATAPVLGVFGYVYPGKGHRQVVRAAAALRRAGTLGRRCACSATPHGPRRRGRGAAAVQPATAGSRSRWADGSPRPRWSAPCAGSACRWPPTATSRRRAASTRGSRRAVVRSSVTARTPGRWRHCGPGPSPSSTTRRWFRASRTRCADPPTTWIEPGTDLGPRLEDTAAAYRSWWAAVGG